MVKIRVHELAKELGITSRTTMERLHRLGEPVRSPSSMLGPQVADDLRVAFGRVPWAASVVDLDPADLAGEESSAEQRPDENLGLVQRIMKLRDSGNQSEADDLADEASTVLQDTAQELPISERHFLKSFVSDPYLRLPRSSRSKVVRPLDQRESRPSRSLREQKANKVPRPRGQANTSQALHKIAERNAKDTLRPRPSDGRPRQNPPQQLKQLLRDVVNAELSQDRLYRRDILRQVSLYLYQLPGVQPDTPGINKLRAFRDHPFRGLDRDTLAVSERGTLDGEHYISAIGPTEGREPSVEEPLRVPTPAELAARIAPRSAVEARNASATSAGLSSPRQDDLARSKTYQTFFTFDAEIFGAVKSVVDEWLSRKQVGVEVGRTSTESAEGRVAKSLTTSAGQVKFHRLSMVEEQPQQNFHTEIVLGEDPVQAWLWVSIWSDGMRPAHPPRFMRTLFEVAGPLSALGVRGPTFTIVEDEREALYLKDYLIDPGRQLPVFVAGTDRVPQDDEFEQEFRASARRWAQDTLGLATFVVLGPRATERLEEELGDSFAPRRWAIRTYEPRLKLEDRHDARRHRFFGTERLAQWEPIEVSRRLGTVARAISHQRTTPPQLRSAQLAFTQEENTQLLHDLRNGSRPDLPRIETSRSQNPIYGVREEELSSFQLLKELLDEKEFVEELALDVAQHFRESSPTDFRQIEDRLKNLTGENEQLHFHRDQALEEAALGLQHLARVENDVQRLRQQMKWLQSELAERGEFEAAYTGVQIIPDEAPSNFEELLDEISAFEDFGVIFTGHRASTLALDDIDTQGQAVHAAWMSFHTLADYLRACQESEFRGNVHMYLSNPPSPEYTVVAPTNHAARESATTMSQFGNQRVFKVPDRVSESGYAEMQAHFKLHRIGIQSPRMHYLDRSHDEGKIYVGYIGPHLDTPATN